MSTGRHAGGEDAPAALSPRPLKVATVLEALSVFVVCGVIAFPRGGTEALHGVMWAEDGSVFLQGAYVGHGWHALLAPYQGYALVLPRLIASLVSYFPMGWHGFLVNAAAVAVQAAVAVFAFHVVRSHTRGWIAAVVVVAGVAAVPVGPETVDNVSNLQWFLLFAACIASLWEPRTAIGRAAAITVVCAAVTTSPFGLLAVLVTAVAWYVARRTDLVVLLLTGLAALAVQVIVMIGAPPREIPVTPQWNPFAILDEYVRRVPGDGVLGLGRYSQTATSSALLPGVVVVVVVALLAAWVARTEGWAELVLPAVTLALSGVTFAAPVALSDITGAVPPVIGGRYSVAPALLFYFALGLLVERVLLTRATPFPDASGRRSDRGAVGPRIVAIGLMGALVYGLVSSWSDPRLLRRDTPSWSSEIARGRAVCHEHSNRRHARLRISPVGWQVVVACSRLTAGH